MSSARWSRRPRRTRVTGSATTTPALRSPIKVRNTPIPTAVAARRLGGMAFTIVTRKGVAERIRNRTPAQKTMPKATRQGTPAAQDDGEGEEAVDAHPRRHGEGQARIQAHQQGHREADEHRRRQCAAEGKAGALGRQDRGVHDDDIGHREEGGDPGDGLGGEGTVRNSTSGTDDGRRHLAAFAGGRRIRSTNSFSKRSRSMSVWTFQADRQTRASSRRGSRPSCRSPARAGSRRR